MRYAVSRRKVLWSLAVLSVGATSPSAAVDCRIAILGDSLKAGYGLALAEAFPARLEAALPRRGFACTVLDAGVSGDTSAGRAARVAWVLTDRPTHLLVELGGNDALRALPPEQLQTNLERIVLAARQAGVFVMIAGGSRHSISARTTAPNSPRPINESSIAMGCRSILSFWTGSSTDRNFCSGTGSTRTQPVWRSWSREFCRASRVGCDRPPFHRRVERRCDGVPLPAQRLAHKLLTILGISSRERSCGITSPRA